MLRILGLLALLTSAPALATTLEVDTKTSQLKWLGSKVIGGSHNGLVPVKEGKIEWDKGSLKQANLVVHVAELTNLDLSGKYNKDLVGHLKSDDFFSTDKYPEASIAITSAKKLSGNNYEFAGNLTIKGVTKPTKFEGSLIDSSNSIEVKGKMTFDRTAYGVKYNSGKFFPNLGDKIIKDEVVIDFNIVAKK